MALMIAKRHLRPGEFDEWEARFRERAKERKAAGCKAVRYFRGADNKDEVVMIFDWDTREQGQSFLERMLSQFPNLSQEGRSGFFCMFVDEQKPLDA